MEIETKVFDIKKIRKAIARHDMSPKRVCDIMDYLFEDADFSPDQWSYMLPQKKKSGQLCLGRVCIEIPDTDVLLEIRDFSERPYRKWSKIRLRTVDDVPYITLKWPKLTIRGVKSREEIETRIGSLSDMMMVFLLSGARLEKSISRVREIYLIPGYPDAELVIDMLESARGTLEYAEIECGSEKELREILKKVFQMDMDDISDKGITGLHRKTVEKSVSRKLSLLESMMEG